VFLVEPLLDGSSVEIQPVTLTNERDIVIPHCSIYRRFGFAEQFANILYAHQLIFKR
jgi:hypothetical protein